MSDNITVINLMDRNYKGKSAQFAGNFISLVTEDPELAATETEELVIMYLEEESEYDTEVIDVPGKKPVIPIWLRELGLTITFRDSAMNLGKPPGAKMLQ